MMWNDLEAASEGFYQSGFGPTIVGLDQGTAAFVGGRVEGYSWVPVVLSVGSGAYPWHPSEITGSRSMLVSMYDLWEPNFV